MPNRLFDLVVIGAGPGGYPAAIRAAQKGLKVALVEKGQLGGTCLHRGCIPSKAYIAAAEILLMSQRASRLGVHFTPPRIDYPALVGSKDQKVKKLESGIGMLLKGNGVEVIQGEARLEGVTKVRVGEEVIEGKNILIATGSEPIRPATFSFDGESILTTDELFLRRDLPQRLLIVGGGVIGCELASAYNLLGSQVTMVEMLPEILPQEGGSVSKTLRAILEKRGIKIVTGVKLESLEKGGAVKATLSNGETVETDLVLISIGRKFGEDRLGLQKAGVKIDKGFVSVDHAMRTAVPSIYAVGDVVGKTMLAHGATAEGLCAVENILGKATPMDYDSIPRITYTLPEVASIGRSEKGLKEAGVSYKVGRFSYLANGMALLHEESDGFAEIYIGEKGKVLGATVLGAYASHLIQEVAIIMRNRLSVDALTHTIHPHPTFAEIIHEAAEDSRGMAIHKIGRRP